MESFNFPNIKLEKPNAILKHKRRQRVTAMFRFIELCIFLTIISRFTTQLPVTFKLSTEYFKGLGITLISPRFVFVLGNVIVIILFLKSAQSSGNDDSKIDLYDEYKEKCTKNKELYAEQGMKQNIKQSMKQSILAEEREVVGTKIHRSQSESLLRLSHNEKPIKELRRLATVGCRKSGEKAAAAYAEEEMSSEDFRKTVEAFIARQQRFLREEEFSAVVSYEA